MPIRVELALPCRLEKAIMDLNPNPINIDPTTNFWTVYKKFADGHDEDLVSKYAEDLDTSLLFVSTSASLTRPILLNLVLLLY
jgi:hypothetical protein